MFRRTLAALTGAALLYGCASSQGAKQESASAAPAASPLSALVGRQMLVLPAQYLSLINVGGGADIVPGSESLLPIVDEEIADVFRKRGVKNNWTFGREITESANRQGGLAGDPRNLGAAAVRRIKPGDNPLPEPMAGNVRNVVALTSARFVILPIEVSVDLRDNARRGSMRVLVIDSRTARVTWADDIMSASSRDPRVVSEATSPYGFRMLARELASKFADMVVAQ